MNFKEPDTMNEVIGRVLRYGVIVSAAVVVIGIARFAVGGAFTDVSTFLVYNPSTIPHGTYYSVSFSGIVSGLTTFNAYSIVEVGVILLIATPVSRVLISVLLFRAEGDRVYVLITGVVLVLLLFSILVTPYIPVFHG